MIDFKNSPDQVKQLETLVKLRDFDNAEAPHLKHFYTLKFTRLKEKGGFSDQDLKDYDLFKIAEAIKNREILNQNAVFLNGIKFKSKEDLREFLKAQGGIGMLRFFFSAIWNAFKEKFKKQKS